MSTDAEDDKGGEITLEWAISMVEKLRGDLLFGSAGDGDRTLVGSLFAEQHLLMAIHDLGRVISELKLAQFHEARELANARGRSR